MQKLSRIVVGMVLSICISSYAQQVQFNADSAYAYLEHLCVRIGPRPMGSANEWAALQWTKEKFSEFGANTAFVMPMTNDGRDNTHSGIAVGIFRGQTDSTIVIGGHIDSAGREIPGANDDGSGTACVIELARIWSQRPRHYTLLFAAFCGEERGLKGSTHFVNNYRELDKVALMLQIDMAGTDDWLIPFFDTKSHQAPKWLVKDTYQINRDLGDKSLYYPTHFFSINNSMGGAGSDHEPFLEKDIPAIDFTTGINKSPIHTQRDKIDFISKPMLARSGNLVDGLITKYQKEKIPPGRKDHYMAWQIFGYPIFIPNTTLIAINILAILLAAFAFYLSRKNRIQIEKPRRVKFSGTKLLLIMVILAIFAQLGAASIQWLKGLRYPWMVNFNGYLVYAVVWTIAGLWLCFQLIKQWKFSLDPYVYSKRAFIFLISYTVLLALASPRLGLYPSLTMIGLSLAVLLPSAYLKIIVSVLAPFSMFRLMFSETFPFMGHVSTELGVPLNSFLRSFLYNGFLTLLLILWFLPILYTLSYTWVNQQPILNRFKNFARPVYGLIILIVVVGYGSYLYSSPSYNEEWRASLQVQADYDMGKQKSKLSLVGNEYFRHVKITADTLHTDLDQRSNTYEVPLIFEANWIHLTGTESVSHGKKDSVSVNWQLISQKPWYQTSLEIQADTLEITNLTSDLIFHKPRKSGSKTKNRAVVFSWYSEPPETLQVKASFVIAPGAKIFRKINAVYPGIPVPVTVTAQYADVSYRTNVTYQDTVTVK